MATGDRGARPVELDIAAAVLAGLGLAFALEGLWLMAKGPLSAVAGVGGVMIVFLAWGAWLGSHWVRNTLVVAVVVMSVPLLMSRDIWPAAVVLLLAGVLITASPRIRAWYRAGLVRRF